MVASCDLLQWPAKFRAVWSKFALGFGLFSPCDWALIYLVSGPFAVGLMLDACIVVFLVYFRHILCVILTCPLANDESTKPMETC